MHHHSDHSGCLYLLVLSSTGFFFLTLHTSVIPSSYIYRHDTEQSNPGKYAPSFAPSFALSSTSYPSNANTTRTSPSPPTIPSATCSTELSQRQAGTPSASVRRVCFAITARFVDLVGVTFIFDGVDAAEGGADKGTGGFSGCACWGHFSDQALSL